MTAETSNRSSAILTVGSTYRFQRARTPFLLNISRGAGKEWLVCTRVVDAHTLRVRQATLKWRLLVWVVHVPAHVKYAYRDARDWFVDGVPDEQDATTWMAS